jgi:hypothetical protein
MDTPSSDQVQSWVRTTIAGVGGWAVGKGYGDASLWTMIGGVASLAVPYVWGAFAHTNAAKLEGIATMPRAEKNAAFGLVSDTVKLAAVEAMPDVKRILVQKDSKDGVADALANPDRPKVVSI